MFFRMVGGYRYRDVLLRFNWLTSLPNNKFVDYSRLKGFADEKINVTKKLNCVQKGRKHCEKRTKCWLQAFSPFPTMFSRGIFFRVV